MSRIRDAFRVLAGDISQRDASLGSLLGDRSRISTSSAALPTQDTAMRNSIWWAGIHVRANLMSSFPLDVFSDSNGLAIPRKKSPLFEEPWPGIDISEWIYGVESDLCRYGNSIGIIRERNYAGNPTQVEPVEMASDVRAVVEGRNKLVAWRIGQEEFKPQDIWHQRRHVVNGVPLGLNPLAYAAYSMSIYNSAQEFAVDWFGMGMNPRGVLKATTMRNVPADVREQAKELFRASIANGDPFVIGTEFEWTPASSADVAPDFLSQQAESSRDVCRFLGVPASMLDVEVSTGNVTYANITQANLQFLITQLGPDTNIQQRYWSRHAVPKPWYVKFNTDALLKMDPQTRTAVFTQQLASKTRVPSEVRALDNMPPYTPEQLQELELFSKMGKSAPAPAPATNEPAPAAEGTT